MKKHIISGIIALALTMVVGLFAIVSQNPQKAEGSVVIGQEYSATTTESSLDLYKKCMPLVATTTASLPKTLGSIVVTLTSNAPLYIYDATTTGPHSDHATTSIAMFKTTTVGTYTFDIRAKRGICVVAGESSVGTASTTITFRQ